MTKAIVQNFDQNVMTLLLDQQENDVYITEEVLQAAAKNSRSDKEITRLFLDRRKDDVQNKSRDRLCKIVETVKTRNN